jgi:hypothetical protein
VDHPCAKYGWKDYYWCFIEANDKGWTWDYCAPVFDRNEYLGYKNFRANFDLYTDELPIPLLTPPLYNFSAITAANIRIGSGGDNPYVFRLLSNRGHKGNGLSGFWFPSFLSNHPRTDDVPRWSNIEHVANNPTTTPWISTSRNLRRQESLIHRNIRRDPKHRDVYLVAIDLYRLGNRKIVDLSKESNRQRFLGNNQQANDYAAAWDVVLIHWPVPLGAVIESVRYYYDAARNMTQYEVLRNPFYRPEPAIEPRVENGNFPDNVDRSGYP